jgi:hypothetical protein
MPLIRINRNPSRRQLAVFALAWAVVLAAIGALSWRHGRHGAAEIEWALAAAAPLAGVASMEALRALYLLLSYAAYPVGFVVSHVVLAVIYYLAIAPVGLTMRALGYDPLGRKFDRAAATYWTAREPRTVKDYFKQS